MVEGFSLSGWRANSKAFNLDFVSVEGWMGGFVEGRDLLVASLVDGFLSKLRLPCHGAFDCGASDSERRVSTWPIVLTLEP